MQESLIGYLLGALDADEAARLEARLEQDPQLQERLRHAAQTLRPLKVDDDDIEPPPGLAQGTCCYVERAKRLMPSACYERVATSPNWTLVDLTIAAGIFLAACLLFFPAINNSRYHAQVAGCQNNLLHIGRALIKYSENSHGLFPQVPATGNMAVAGMYAPTLRALELIIEDRRFLCPASVDSETDMTFRIPAVEEIEQARGPTLIALQSTMGGDYGYKLGYMTSRGKLSGTPNRRRVYFVLMSDAPGERFLCDTSSRRGFSKHRNVLFESGHVRLLPMATVCWCKDELFTNDRGEISAGTHVDDTVIANSGTAPLSNVWLVK